MSDPVDDLKACADFHPEFREAIEGVSDRLQRLEWLAAWGDRLADLIESSCDKCAGILADDVAVWRRMRAKAERSKP
jgi:phage-related minor tail protein